MPMYTITHAHPIPRDVQLKIAQKFTEIHCARYKMPTSFVNINFVPVNPEETYYVGGKLIPSKTRIMGQVRPGESRSVEGFEQLVSELAAAFTEFAGGHGDEIAYVADIAIAIKENGVLIPRAGKEGQWFKDNKELFERRAQTEEAFAVLVKEFYTSPDLIEISK